MMKHDVMIRPLGQPGDLGWVVKAHGEIYAREFDWNGEFEALVARIVADYATASDPGRQAAWIAEINGERVASVFLTAHTATVAQLRALLVHPSARGYRLGRELVNRCVDFARLAGYERLTLWTVDVLDAARTIYLAAGFRLVDESAQHSFGKDLVGQTYHLDLNVRGTSSIVEDVGRGTCAANPAPGLSTRATE